MILCPHGVVRRTEDEIAECVESGGFTEPAELQSGEPFNKPTDCWVDPKTGDIFISDGYGNSRVHRLKADGTPILSWGTPGTDAGEFQLVHNICGHPDGDKVIVCDRENSRVQVCVLHCIEICYVRERSDRK
jgi:sugar lactone lactonase YvrE